MRIQKIGALRSPFNYLRRVFSKFGLHRPAYMIMADDFWWYGEPEIRLLPWLVDPNKIAVDIGAANGVYSRHLLRLAKSVVAFEPNPISYALLRKAAPQLDVRQIALSNQSGKSTLRIPISGQVAASGWGTIHEGNDFSEISPESTKDYIVEMAPLDAIEIGDIGFIKIDVEGHENEVLEGANNILKSCKPNILIEVSGDTRGNNPNNTCKMLHEIGYTTVCLKDGKMLQRINQVPSGIDAINIIAVPDVSLLEPVSKVVE